MRTHNFVESVMFCPINSRKVDETMAKVGFLLMLILKVASSEKFISSINKFEDSEIRGRNKKS